MTFSERVATVRKALVTLAGVLGTLITANLLPGPVAGWASTAVGVVTVILTYWVPNADPPGRHSAPE